MNKSESIKELTAALAKAQGKLKNPAFDKMNPHFRNKYASLAAIRDAVIPTLASEGLTLTQWLSSGEHTLRCETMISHSSGEWISEMLELPVSKHDAQGFASAATYARRISMQSAVGVTGDEDDDGTAASNAAPAKTNGKAPITARGGSREACTPEQVAEVDRLAGLVLDALNAGDESLAYQNYVAGCRALRGSPEPQAAFTDCFTAPQRTLFKKYREAELVATQA